MVDATLLRGCASACRGFGCDLGGERPKAGSATSRGSRGAGLAGGEAGAATGAASLEPCKASCLAPGLVP